MISSSCLGLLDKDGNVVGVVVCFRLVSAAAHGGRGHGIPAEEHHLHRVDTHLSSGGLLLHGEHVQGSGEAGRRGGGQDLLVHRREPRLQRVSVSPSPSHRDHHRGRAIIRIPTAR